VRLTDRESGTPEGQKLRLIRVQRTFAMAMAHMVALDELGVMPVVPPPTPSGAKLAEQLTEEIANVWRAAIDYNAIPRSIRPKAQEPAPRLSRGLPSTCVSTALEPDPLGVRAQAAS
jgi:hypothetical protein